MSSRYYANVKFKLSITDPSDVSNEMTVSEPSSLTCTHCNDPSMSFAKGTIFLPLRLFAVPTSLISSVDSPTNVSRYCRPPLNFWSEKARWLAWAPNSVKTAVT